MTDLKAPELRPPSTEHSSNPENLTADPSAVTASGHSQASDSDSDIEQDLRNKFEELALNKIEQRDYAKAELFLRRIVANEEAKGTADGLLLIKIKIATTCCFQGRWEEAESMAIPVAMGKDRVDISAFHILHTFSIRKYQQGKMEEAARWCKRALWGKKRLLGKNDTSYHESMALLARIYDSQGDAMEAEACRSFIPSTTTIDQDPLSYLYKTISAKTSPMHQLGSKNPFNPTPQIRSTQPQLTTPPIETPPLLQTPEPVRSSFRDRLGLGVPNPRSQPNPGRVAPQQSPALETERRVPGDFGGTSADSRSPNSESPTTARPLSRPKRRLVVCIDFGTTFTGVAYCYAPDGGQEKKIEVKDTWPGAGVIRMRRIPSVIYYDALKEVCGWGPDNADAVQNTGYTKVGVDKCEWLRAYLTTGRPRMYPIRLPALPTGKTAVDVIADYLHYLKMVILSDSRAASFVPFVSPDYRGPVSEIEWCFTLPPDADTVFTEAYRSAIVQAGYVQDEDKSNLTFIKGLEACCVSALESGLIPIEGQPVVLVVKCGGGIVELMAYEVINNNPLEFREVTAASGDSCG